jgi:putative hydrolase of the HAD superfamily
MNKKCILFDADGVIIHTEMFSVQYQKEFDVPMDVLLPFFKGVFKDCLIGKVDLKQVIQPYLSQWNWVGDVDGFLQYWFKAEHNVDERMVSLITELRKNAVYCYLATNQEKYRTEYMRKEMGFGDIFDGIFSSADIGCKKPDREFYEFIFREVAKKGVSKEQIFWGSTVKGIF